jgi:hypothetical protein
MTLFPTLTQAGILSRQSVTVDEVDRLLFTYNLPGREDFLDDVIKITTQCDFIPSKSGWRERGEQSHRFLFNAC